ncbi:flagellar hook-associated protein 2 [Candidatus Pantoea symbiotica]|jgi:flagellar hook-associated protein 2|uniref:Flagellar hook-associated protein 2 n=1 Tax=Candidatus Pantoea symbiotica TaxID=1884370 RepID=A0A1I3T1V0_9GAMM|nr:MULTISPECIES: flagellar filament capping protein FliD [Pantoea]KAJ9432708.1 flagellar filament capping protein FliD [Pantoea sp. YR343]MRT23498.1 flagellar filament capping protein FliD [Enterobacteriaceae bacterium RIT697]SFJ63517.1 flagellar hook-associated protein 2 [Pantoea symbiotica]SFU53296.1 flagellar hook-associated protein 2 [Pantoea sp. YR525]
MTTISTLGIGSGLDLSTILDNLSTAEKASLTPISNQQTAYTAKLSAYGTLSSALTTFQTANTALNSADLFTATSAASSTTAFSATTSGSTIAGKYSISVTQLAQAQTLTSGVQTSNTTALGSSDASRTLSIKLADGTSKDITLTSDQTSLTGMRDAINGANAGVSASIIKTGDGAYRLSLTASKTGEANAVSSVTVTGDDTLQGIVGFDSTKTDADNPLDVSVAAQDAELTVNNVAITSSTNTISDALEGITLNLNDVTSGNQTLTITQDTSKASTAISNFVDAYNNLLDQFTSLTKYTAVDVGSDTQDSSNGALVGDSTLRGIQTQIKSLLTNTASSSTYKTLAQIGITTDPTTGELSLDSDKLKTELTKDPAGVKEMIVGDGKTTGITTKLATNLTSWLSSTGSIQSAKDGVSKTLNNLTEQYNNMNTRINALIARYKTQFTQLDVTMSSLNSTSDYLTQQFDSMTSSSSSK